MRTLMIMCHLIDEEQWSMQMKGVETRWGGLFHDVRFSVYSFKHTKTISLTIRFLIAYFSSFWLANMGQQSLCLTICFSKKDTMNTSWKY